MKAKKEVKLKELEQSWDSDVRYPKESKRYVRMSNDVENFVKNSSYSASPYTNESPQSFNNPNKTSFRTSSGDNSDMFSRISSTFGFKHHLGTDKKLELKVIKIILIRENILMNLRHQSDKSLEQANIDNSCGHIIQLLAQLRECTLNYLEALCMWRESAHHNASGHGQGPPAFIWENMNYTIKIVNDLDFIAENYLLVEALNMDPVQLQSNPLMLANNLEDSNTWMSPQERAASDCNGNGNAAYYQNRLRLRFAERIILQEIEAATVALSQNNSANNSVMMPRSTPDYGNYSHFDKGSAAFDDNSYVSYESGPNLVKPAWTDRSRALSAQKVSQESNRVPTGSRPSTMQSSLPQSSQTDRVASRANAPDAPQFTAHDFFSGNWSTNSNGDMEDSTAGIAVNKEFEETKDSYFPYGPNSDEFDVKSAKSIDSIGSQDLQVALAIADPPRNLVLAASAAVVILSVYDQLPNDVSWEAFVELSTRMNVAQAMTRLHPLNVPFYKIKAIEPFLDELTALPSEASNSSLTFQEQMGAIKIINWVKQFVVSAVTKHEAKRSPEGLVSKRLLEPLECTIISKDGTPIPVIKQKKIVKKSNKVKSVDNYDSDMLPPRDSRKVVPKVQLELYPYHTELIDNKYKNPLILVLLTSTNYRKGMKGDALDSLINKNVTGPPPERLIAKVFDVIDNEEAQVNINMREYTLFLSDLNMKYDALASMYFLPENVRWWALNFKHVMLVKARADGSLALFIDKKAIDTFISKEIRRANGETVSEGPSRAGSPMNKMRITSSSHSDGYASNYDNDELSPEPETNATPQEPLELELNDSEEGKPKRRKKKIKMTKTSAPSAVMAVSNSEPVLVKPVESVSKQKNAAKPTVTVKKAGIVSTIRSTTQSNNDNDIASVGKNSVPKMRPMNSKKLTTPIKQSAKPVPIAKPAPLVSKKVLPVQPKVAAGKDSAKNKFGKSSIASSSGDSAPTIAKKVSPKEKGSNNAALVSPKKSAVEPISPAPKGQSIDAKTHAEIVGAVTDSKNDCADEKQSYIAINETRARQASSSDLYEDKEFEEAAKTPKKSLERVTFDEGIKANTTSSNAKIGLSVDPIVELNQAAPLTAKSDGGYEDDNFDSPAETPLKGEKHTDMGNTQLSAKFSDEYDDDCFEDLPKTPAKPMEVFDDKTDSTGQKPVPKPPLDPRTNTKGKNEIVLQERKKEADESHDDAQSTVDDVSLLDLDPMDHIDGSEAHSHPENSNSAKPSNSTHGSKDDSDTNTVGLVLDPQADNNSVGLSIGDSVTYAEVISSISRHPEIVKAAPRAADANVPDAVPEEDDGTNAVLKLKDSSSSVVRSISNSQDKSVKEKGIALGGKLDDSADYSLSKDENEIQGIPIAQPSIDIVESESLYGVDFEHDSEVGDNTVANEKRKASIETTGSLSKPSAVSYNDDFEQSSVVLQ